MGCSEGRSRSLAAWIDGELGAIAVWRLRRHLAGCPSCRAEERAQRSLLAELIALDPAAPHRSVRAAHGVPWRLAFLAGLTAGLGIWQLLWSSLPGGLPERRPVVHRSEILGVVRPRVAAVSAERSIRGAKRVRPRPSSRARRHRHPARSLRRVPSIAPPPFAVAAADVPEVVVRSQSAPADVSSPAVWEPAMVAALPLSPEPDRSDATPQTHRSRFIPIVVAQRSDNRRAVVFVPGVLEIVD
jgi:hypothetical protein